MGSRKTLIVLSFLALAFVVVFAAALGLSQAEKFVATRARKEFAALKPTIDVTFEKVKINPFTRMLIFNGIEIRSPSFPDVLKIRAASAGGIDWKSIGEMIETRKPVVPRHVYLAIYGLSVPVKWTGEKPAETLYELGYDTLDLSAS
ncbi:MAG: hypothetical protein AAB250_15915, partial [Bdellovibrionota bacterium]